MSEEVELIPGNVKDAMRSIQGKSRDLWFVKPQDIHVIPGFNIREHDDEYKAHVRSMADSMKAEGFKAHKPLVGFVAREGGESVIKLTDGHTRLEAVLLAISEGTPIELVPFIPHPPGTTMEDLHASMAMDNSGKPLKPLELARLCKRMLGYGHDNAGVAKRLNISVGYVGKLLTLLSAPKVVRDMVKDGKVSAATAINVMRNDGEKASETLQEAAKAAAEGGKSKVTAKAISNPKDPYQKGLKWIQENSISENSKELLVGLLACVTNKKVATVMKALE